MSVLSALTLYNVTVSSYSQVDPQALLKDEQDSDEEKLEEAAQYKPLGDLDKVDIEETNQFSSNVVVAPQKLKGLQDDLFNMIQLMCNEPSELLRLSGGGGQFFPSKLPVSSVLLAMTYLIQSPLPLALN